MCPLPPKLLSFPTKKSSKWPLKEALVEIIIILDLPKKASSVKHLVLELVYSQTSLTSPSGKKSSFFRN